MLEKAKETTRQGLYPQLEYASYADDVVVLSDCHPRNCWLIEAVQRRMKEELEKLQLELNQQKSKVVDLTKGESFMFLGFVFRRVKARSGKWRPYYTPHQQARTKRTTEISRIFYRYRSQPVNELIRQVNPKLEGFMQLLSDRALIALFQLHQTLGGKESQKAPAEGKRALGVRLEEVSSAFIYEELGLYNDYKLKRFEPAAKTVS